MTQLFMIISMLTLSICVLSVIAKEEVQKDNTESKVCKLQNVYDV